MDPGVKTEVEEKPEQGKSPVADDKPPSYSTQAEAQPPPLPPRVTKPAANPRGGSTAPASVMTQTKDMMAQATTTAKRYGSFWAEHIKKGEMPWTQWFCCGVVGGKECENENHRLHKQCKKCGHRVCENCPKSQL